MAEILFCHSPVSKAGPEFGRERLRRSESKNLRYQ